MQESPLFLKIKETGKHSKNPLKDSFGKKENLKYILLILFGALIGEGVMGPVGGIYGQIFVETICKIDFSQTRYIILYSSIFSMPFYVFFGWMSDLVGRKWLILSAMFLGILFYKIIYMKIFSLTDAKNRTELVVHKKSNVSCKAFLNPKNQDEILIETISDTVYSDQSVYRYTNIDTVLLAKTFVPPQLGFIKINNASKNDSFQNLSIVKFVTSSNIKSDASLVLNLTNHLVFKDQNQTVIKTVGSKIFWNIVGLFLILNIIFTMIYGPIAAFLVESFPTHIRYTAVSLPYHIGNGIFGGLVPFLGILLFEMSKTAQLPAGDILIGLNYPIAILSLSFIIGLVFFKKQ